MKPVFHEAALREFNEAVDYYSNIGPELGVRFYHEIERLILEVCQQPQLFRQFDPPARRHFSDRFPSGIIYLVQSDHLWIVAVMQLHREPGYWRERVS